MQCARCHHENRPGAKFCEECAAPLARACANCRAPLSATAKFCSECAHPAGQAATARFAVPEAYTPRHLAERILTSKAALEGERKQVTVLFADLKGSMELLADRDPEEARRILDPVLERMMDAVHRYEGTVNQVMGDGIMALFGAPLAHEDHAVRACYATLRMQDAVRRYSDELRRAQGVEVQIRVGLNSGEVVVRSIGNDLRMDYTAVGQTTHLAARMEQLAAPGTVRLTGETLRLAEGYVEVRSLGPIPVKGLSDPIEIFELTGAGQARTRLQAAALRGLTRFVGRDAEVEHLRRVLGLASAGRGQVAAIVGEAGVGKSRLTYEFTRSHRVQDWLILEASSVSYGKATSYLPMIDLLKGYFKIGDRDNHREMRDKVMGRVLGLDRALEPLLPPLLALLDVPVEDATWQPLDAPQRRQRTLDAVKRLLLRESQVQPLLVVFEDLHWIDGETQALLDSLVDSLGSARLLLLVNYRPEYQHGWSGKTAYSQMRLDALAAESAGELLDALLGDDPGLAPLKQLLVKRGNPFFLEETVRTLVETRVLDGSRGGYRLMQPLQALQVPPTVHTILAARIDRLSAEDKRLLQTASVVGKDVPFALLQAIAELPDEALRAALDRLRAAEFLYETRLFPDLEYAFKHALTHEVTYQSLLAQRRKELHGAIGQAIEDLYADRLEEHAPILAYHYARSERGTKAVEYALLAGDQAARLYANAEAITYYEQALAIARALPSTAQAQCSEIDAALKLAAVGMTRQDIERDQRNVERARELAEQLQDKRRLAQALYWLGRLQYVLGDYARAIEYAEQSLEIADRLGDEALAPPPVNLVARGCWRSDPPKACRMIERSVEQMSRLGNKGEEATASGFAALPFAATGEFDRALAYANRGLALAQEIQNPLAEAAAYQYRASLHDQRGECARAIADYEYARRIAERAGDLFRVYIVKFWESRAHTRAGDASRGRTLAEEGFALAEQIGTKFVLAQGKVSLAEALLALGEVDEACRVCREAIILSEESGDGFGAAIAHRTLAESLIRLHPPDSHWQREILEAIRLQRDRGAQPELARSYASYARLLAAAGETEQTRAALTQAVDMFRRMGMVWDLERAEQALREP